MILKNFNIYVSSAANLVHVEKILSREITNMVALVFPILQNG